MNDIINAIDWLAYQLSPANLELGRVYLSLIIVAIISFTIIYKKNKYRRI